MEKYRVAIEKYSDGAVKKAIDKSGAFDACKAGDRVFIKPNIVVWTDVVEFPKWGVLTTSRVVEDVVKLLVEKGVTDITIGEGMIRINPDKTELWKHAYKTLGYEKLKERYGVKLVDIFSRPFTKVEIEGINLQVNSDILEADFVVNLPVLKTHAQTVVSLGSKNLKGVLNIASRKRCHSADDTHSLDFMISRLPSLLPPSATIIDGIYTLERGPALDGRARRSDLIIASSDTLSADLVGAKVLGHQPESVPYLAHEALALGRPVDLSDVAVIGERVEDVASFHEWDFKYNKDDTLHGKMEKAGIKGLTYRKYDNTMCTYCSVINGAVIMAILFAWKGEPWDSIDILTGKKMKPIPGHQKTILLGSCMYALNKDNPDINEMIAVKGCPPDPEETAKALQKAGIPVNEAIFQNIEQGMAIFMQRYKDKPEFDESFFRIE